MSTLLSLRRAGTPMPLAPSGFSRLFQRRSTIILLALFAGLLLYPPDSSAGPAPGPSVTAVSPTFGPTAGGTLVSITGSGFTGATAVTFGLIAAAGFVVNADTSITATSPPEGVGTVDITVTQGTTSATSPADQFTYIPAATSTPTLGAWSMLALALLLAVSGYLVLMRATRGRAV